MKCRVKMLAMDIDGTLTDGKIYIGPDGEAMKAFNVKDGYGIKSLLSRYEIKPAVITGRDSEIVAFRCSELGISTVVQGCTDKLKELYEIAKSEGLRVNENGTIEGLAYIGDDINDVEAMRIAMISGCPSDAVQEVKRCADFVSSFKGGDGAVRDFIHYIIGESNLGSPLNVAHDIV